MTDADRDYEDAGELLALVRAGWARDGLSGAMARLSVPLDRESRARLLARGTAEVEHPPEDLLPELERLAEKLGDIVTLLQVERDLAPSPAGGECATCLNPFTVGGPSSRSADPTRCQFCRDLAEEDDDR